MERFLTGAVRFSLEPQWFSPSFGTYLLYTIWDFISLTIFGRLGEKGVDPPLWCVTIEPNLNNQSYGGTLPQLDLGVSRFGASHG